MFPFRAPPAAGAGAAVTTVTCGCVDCCKSQQLGSNKKGVSATVVVVVVVERELNATLFTYHELHRPRHDLRRACCFSRRILLGFFLGVAADEPADRAHERKQHHDDYKDHGNCEPVDDESLEAARAVAEVLVAAPVVILVAARPAVVSGVGGVRRVVAALVVVLDLLIQSPNDCGDDDDDDEANQQGPSREATEGAQALGIFFAACWDARAGEANDARRENSKAAAAAAVMGSPAAQAAPGCGNY
jgi:hypothetical protein